LNSYSQAGQDVFALAFCKGKLDGTFIDLGCNDPFVHNNTAALEELGWTGVCIDIIPFDYSKRKSPFVLMDLKMQQIIPDVFRDFLHKNKFKVDYLSADADDDTEMIVGKLTALVQFNVITVEHDRYRVGPDTKFALNKLLTSRGYELMVEDVKAPTSPGMPWSGQPFEDWYVR